MQLTFKLISDLKFGEAQRKVQGASEEAMKDLISDIAADVIDKSPWLTGNNARSIDFEASKLEGSVYSTSGYGGFLETGTSRRPATPYFRPALDRNAPRFPELLKARL